MRITDTNSKQRIEWKVHNKQKRTNIRLTITKSNEAVNIADKKFDQHRPIIDRIPKNLDFENYSIKYPNTITEKIVPKLELQSYFNNLEYLSEQQIFGGTCLSSNYSSKIVSESHRYAQNNTEESEYLHIDTPVNVESFHDENLLNENKNIQKQSYFNYFEYQTESDFNCGYYPNSEYLSTFVNENYRVSQNAQGKDQSRFTKLTKESKKLIDSNSLEYEEDDLDSPFILLRENWNYNVFANNYSDDEDDESSVASEDC